MKLQCILQAYVYGGCLSPTNRPTTLKFKSAGCCGGLANHLTDSLQILMNKQSIKSEDMVQCFPLTDLLEAIGVHHVDYLSLDVHGAEFSILKTINFHEFRIDALTIECYEPNNATKLQQMINETSELFAATGLYRQVEFIPPYDLVVERIDNNNRLLEQ
jgi:Methyltransferase FkbM domain